MPDDIDHALLMSRTHYPSERWMRPAFAKRMLVLLGVLSLAFGLALRNVELDHDFERFFPTDDPELDRYLAFRERFGNDNDFLLIALEHEPSVFSREFLTVVDSTAARLKRLKDVREVISPTRLTEPRITPAGAFKIPWLHLGNDTLIALDSARIWRDRRMRENFFTQDASAVLVIMLTEPGLDKEESDALLIATEEVLEASGIERIRVAGRIHGQYYYIQKMLRELVTFLVISIGLLSIFLFLTFRTAWGVLVPIGVVGLTVLWQVGIMTLLGEPLSILTMLLPTILFVVGMSDVVHILERYIEALRGGAEKARALAIAFHEVGLATVLTSLTTAIGFATLMTSSIVPIRDFGLYTGLGVMLALVLAFTLLPSVLLLVPTPVKAIGSRAHWHGFLHATFRMVLRYRVAILWGSGVLVLVSSALLGRLKVNNFLLEDWPEDDPQMVDFHYFEDELGGVRPFELEVVISDSAYTVWDLSVLRDIEKVQEYLETSYGIKAMLSPVTVIRQLNKAFNGGSADFERLPDTQEEVRRLVRNASFFAGREGLNTLVTEDARIARITGRMRDEGGYVHKQRNAELEAFVAANTDKEHVRFHQTGMAYLIDRNNEKLSGQLIGGLSVAFVLISFIMAWVFRNIRMTIIALIPNVIPLLFVGAVMGVVGIDIKVSTAIIFTIAFGIAVDDSIHMLGKLRIELAKGLSLPYAMKRAFLSAGKAIIVTSVMILSGFVALIGSDFASVFYMGLLVSLTLTMAVLCDLLLLPVLVLLFLRPKRKDRE